MTGKTTGDVPTCIFPCKTAFLSNIWNISQYFGFFLVPIFNCRGQTTSFSLSLVRKYGLFSLFPVKFNPGNSGKTRLNHLNLVKNHNFQPKCQLFSFCHTVSLHYIVFTCSCIVTAGKTTGKMTGNTMGNTTGTTTGVKQRGK